MNSPHVPSPSITENEVSKLPGVRLTDSTYDMKMYCYENDGVNEAWLNGDSLVPECRGVVFDSEGNLISRAFGYTPQFSSDENSSESVPLELKEFIEQHLTDCRVYPAFEGALVRIFRYNGEWYLTTHRKLDAFKSYWGCRTSFGTMFMNAFNEARERSPELIKNNIFEILNPSRQYVFLVLNTIENRIVCSPPEKPVIIHVGTFENGEEVSEVIPGIYGQNPLEISSYQHLLETASSMNPSMYQGVIVFLPNGRQVKICSPTYLNMFNLRGNEASVMFRYLQIRHHWREMYKTLYPEHSSRFEEYENILEEISRKILRWYQERFIMHRKFILPREEFRVISAAHNCFKNMRSTDSNARVDLQLITSILNVQPPTNLNKMIRRVIEERKPPKEKKDASSVPSTENVPNVPNAPDEVLGVSVAVPKVKKVKKVRMTPKVQKNPPKTTTDVPSATSV